MDQYLVCTSQEDTSDEPGTKASFLMLDMGQEREESFPESSSRGAWLERGRESLEHSEAPQRGELPGARVVWQQGEAACHRGCLRGHQPMGLLNLL